MLPKMGTRVSLIIVLLLILSVHAFSQAFDIGHTSVVFNDSMRSRNVGAEMYYPADNPGTDVPVASGRFPVLVFGHGFLMSWQAYQNFWKELVPEGYVVCFPTTEMGLAPSHEDFARDLKFVVAQMKIENEDSTSLFFQALAPQAGVMGHSMGGGASLLAAENDSSLSALVNFAAAETNPSAISAAANVTVPTLMFSGDDDCVTPASTNQNPIYDGLSSVCKTHISIINGGHCYFADFNFNCNLGETLCNPTLQITRKAQQSVTFDFLKPWLDYSLKGNSSAFLRFNDSLQASSRINFQKLCGTTYIEEISDFPGIEIFPNPVSDQLNLVVPARGVKGSYRIHNLMGEIVYQGGLNGTGAQINVSHFPPGPYFIMWDMDSYTYSTRFVKVASE